MWLAATRVHHQHALLADLHGDIAARARKQKNVPLHWEHLDFARASRLALLRKCGINGGEQDNARDE